MSGQANHARFIQTLQKAPRVLTEGSVVERLRRHPAGLLDPHVANAGLLFHLEGREALAGIYRDYRDIGLRHGLPTLLLTPTWRANAERLARAGLTGRDVFGEAVELLAGLREEVGSRGEGVFIGGLVGCRGDAYRPEEALSREEAAAFHAPHVEALARAGVDFLVAQALPALSEAEGLAQAMARTGAPFLLSFILRPTGTLLDGTPLAEAVARMDALPGARPTAYMVNCVHPSVFREGLSRQLAASPSLGERVVGLQANTSRLSPEELDGRAELDSETPDAFAREMARVHEECGTRLLGGCCGTDERHIAALASALTESVPE
ncbi:homocysteine S-methyltransferase family protein [Corallococcus interemptor]|uniref:Homocysteine S-methyltransferase family protein n=1 Tax=Corallococcus interemptor TaxID=2316720 RepID=A0A3A8QLY1_9BACT|nr:homocysteine S-methyltransferase family protein [Corallococcus interemptor]RKH68811.1 homocysteine S-methyltransferase family protein [Corallococcus interemptor]